MVWSKYERQGSEFAETPFGIVTQSGTWFHVTEEMIEAYVPGLLERKSIDTLVAEAEAWANSTSKLSLVLYLILALLVSPWIALAGTLLFYGLWHGYKSAFAVPALSWLMKLLDNDAVLILASLLALSKLGIDQRYLAFWLGVGIYFIFKLKLLRRLVDWMERSYLKPEVTLNDRLFKMLLMRYGLKYDLSVSDGGALKEQIMQLFRKKRT